MQKIDKRVLLVEDDASIRELFAMALLNTGLNISMAENGEQGVRFALEGHPDLILLDIDMPILNGFEAAAEIRKDEWGKTVPIIFLTNRSDARDHAYASHQHPDRYIVKADMPVQEIVVEVLRALA